MSHAGLPRRKRMPLLYAVGSLVCGLQNSFEWTQWEQYIIVNLARKMIKLDSSLGQSKS